MGSSRIVSATMDGGYEDKMCSASTTKVEEGEESVGLIGVFLVELASSLG